MKSIIIKAIFVLAISAAFIQTSEAMPWGYRGCHRYCAPAPRYYAPMPYYYRPPVIIAPPRFYGYHRGYYGRGYYR